VKNNKSSILAASLSRELWEASPQKLEKRASDNLSAVLTPYEFHTSAGLQHLFPRT